MKIKKMFQRKRLVYTKKYVPSELVTTWDHKGQVYVRIKCTNKADGNQETDVNFKDVTGIKILPSPFSVWMYNLVGMKPIANFYSREKLKPNAAK